MKSDTRLVYGVGITDLPTVDEEGNQLKSYTAWVDMLKRCHSMKSKERSPTYKGCSVAEEWYNYSSFKEWHYTNHVEGFHLDKDLLIPDNKVYGPSTCRYIPQALNNLFLDHGRSRGGYPVGVSYPKQSGKFRAQLRVNGTTKHLGYYTTPSEAHTAYLSAKRSYATTEVNKYLKSGVIDLQMYHALIRKIALLN